MAALVKYLEAIMNMDNLALPVPVGAVGGRGGYIMAALVKTLQAIMNMGNLALLSGKKSCFFLLFFLVGWGLGAESEILQLFYVPKSQRALHARPGLCTVKINVCTVSDKSCKQINLLEMP